MAEERFISLAEALGIVPPPNEKQATAKRRSIRQMAREILSSPEYAEHLQRMIITDTLPPALETMLYHYAEGKPVERVEVTEKSEPLAKVSVEQLEDRITRLHERVKLMRRMESDQTPDEQGRSVH